MRIESYLIGNAIIGAAMAADTAYSVEDVTMDTPELINSPGFVEEVTEFLSARGTPDWALENLVALVNEVLKTRGEAVLS